MIRPPATISGFAFSAMFSTPAGYVAIGPWSIMRDRSERLH
jgi:hypothetical protein